MPRRLWWASLLCCIGLWCGLGRSAQAAGTMVCAFLWQPPAANSDGLPLVDLAGYRLYLGLLSGDYIKGQPTREIPLTELANPAQPGWTLPCPVPGFAVVTAYDAYQNESNFSNEVLVTDDQTAPGDPVGLGGRIVTPVSLLPDALTMSGPVTRGNEPEKILDGRLDTWWAVNGQGQWLQWAFSPQTVVTEVGIAWYLGDQRRATFALQGSDDGATWRPVWSGQSSGTTRDLQSVTFAPATLRYLRLIGQGNTQNTWNSIAEMQVWGVRQP